MAAQELPRNPVALFKRALFAVRTVPAIRDKLHLCLRQHLVNELHFSWFGARIVLSMQK